MQIILPIPQNPFDFVLQGRVIGDISVMDRQIAMADMASMVFDSTCLYPIIQGQVIGNYIPSTVVPAAMIGQHDWYGIKPRQVGPMRMAGGKIEMLDIGQPIPDFTADPFVDPIRKFLKSDLDIDKTGALMVLWEPDVLGALEAVAELALPESNDPQGDPIVTLPRGAIFRSGSAKRMTAPVLPDSFGRHTIIDGFTESTQQWFITVTVRDESSIIVVGASVYLMLADEMEINPDVYGNPINQQAITDSAGQCIFQISANTAHQILGYKTGTPDKSGLSLNTTMGNATVTLYIKDPSSPGGGVAITSWAY